MNYQEKVSTRADVRALYERVIKQPNIKMYRGYTNTNSYAWDNEAEDYVKVNGEFWFPNPNYDLEAERCVEEFESALENLKKQFYYLHEMYLYQKAKNEKAVNGDGESDL